MHHDSIRRDLDRLAEEIAGGGKNVFFTGAGISTESGIPDFRSQGGIWEKYQPIYFDDFMRSRKARIEYWKRKIDMFPGIVKAQPNAAHRAVDRLYKMGLVSAVITQNIDGLHQASGIPEAAVIELHGNTRRIRCMTCGETSSVESALERIRSGDPAPECRCGGYLKPDTISFGQQMPVSKVETAAAFSSESDVFIVIGSTLLVQPAAQMPALAKKGNAFLGIINLSETPLDNIADVRIRRKAGEILPKMVDRVNIAKNRSAAGGTEKRSPSE